MNLHITHWPKAGDNDGRGLGGRGGGGGGAHTRPLPKHAKRTRPSLICIYIFAGISAPRASEVVCLISLNLKPPTPPCVISRLNEGRSHVIDP